MVIIMLGAQGTGKGTVAGLISEQTGLPQISTGDIFRANIEENTELGIEANKYMSQGNLVPDEVTVPMVANRLKEEDAKNGAILDGFPRTIAQAEKLDEILEGLNKKVDMVVNLTTPREEIIDRMVTKLHPPKVEGICDKCGAPLKQREDDSNPEAINKRLEIYENQTAPLVEFYSNKGVLRTETVSVSINRMGNDVAKDIIESIRGDE